MEKKADRTIYIYLYQGVVVEGRYYLGSMWIFTPRINFFGSIEEYARFSRFINITP